MKKFLILLLSTAFVLLHAGTELFRNGSSNWKVIVPQNSDQVVNYAASELIQTLKKVSGVDFARSDTPQAKYNIYLGTPETSPAVAKVRTELKLPAAGAIETVAVYLIGSDLYLAGNNSRAVLYSVYSFLQNQLDVRWYWPGDDGEFIRKQSAYTFPAKLAYNYTPSFKIRAMSPCHWHRHVPTEIWMARNFLNGDSRTASIRDKAGFYRIGGGHRVIVYNRKKVFETNPELFSLIGGRRDIAGYAGCWSNPEFTRQAVENIAKIIEKGNFEILNIFPADITLRCECDKCAAMGGGNALAQTGKAGAVSMISLRSTRWYNYYTKILIPEFRKRFPKLRYAAIAYQEFRALPTCDLPGLDYVEYCHYNRCYAHKLNDPTCRINAASMKEMLEWSKKAPFSVYGYEFDIFSPATFLPNWEATADAMRTYRDMKAVRVKTEMTVFYPKNTPREKLTPQINRIANWMWAQLVWNPDAKVDTLLKDWCARVYGKAAAPYMFAYLKEFGKAWATQKNHPTYFGRTPSGSARYLFDAKRIAFLRSQLNKARAAAKGQPDFLKEINFETVMFQNWERYYNVSGSRKLVMPPYTAKNDNFKNAMVLPLQQKVDGKTAKPTVMKLCWDKKAVYIRVEAMEPDMKNLRMSTKGRDGNVWKDDSVELLFDPGDGNTYRQFVVTAGGATYDALGNDSAYNPKWNARVTRKADRWIADITLPFASFGGFKDNHSWQLMIIRNSKPAAIGFPIAMHMDISSAATVCFNTKTEAGKNVAWIAYDGNPNGFDTYRKFFQDGGWNCSIGVGEKAASKIDFMKQRLILIESYRTRFSADFWRKKIEPAVKNGATLVIRSYFWLDMLGKYLGDESYAVRCREDSHKIRKPTGFAPGFDKAVHDLTKRYRSCGTVTFHPKRPELWTTLVYQLRKDNTPGSAVICRKLGKGKIVIIGQPRGGLLILDNIVKYNP